MAIEKSKLRLDGRHNLEKVLPLAAPYSIYLDPASACNFKCSFCPTGHQELVTGFYKRSIMSFSMFENIISQIGMFPCPLKVLRMNKIGEPTLNSCLPEMIGLARASERIEWIDFATNGSRFSGDNIERFLRSGANRINISLEGLNTEAYLKNAKIRLDFDSFVQNLRDLHSEREKMRSSLKIVPEILIKIPQQLLDSADQETEFKSIFNPIADIIFVESLADIWPDFDVNSRSGKSKLGNIGQYKQPVEDRKVCSVITYSMVVNSDGTVSACCSDWSQSLLIGDTKETPLNKIWHSNAHLRLIKQHLCGKKEEMPTCSSCGHVREAQVDDIDPVADQISGAFEKTFPTYHSI